MQNKQRSPPKIPTDKPCNILSNAISHPNPPSFSELIPHRSDPTVQHFTLKMVLSQEDQIVRTAWKKEVIKITRQQKQLYRDADELRKFLDRLRGKKFKLDCGHHVTVFHSLGNNITIINGSRLKIICTLCSY